MILSSPKDYVSHKLTTISINKSTIFSEGDPKLCNSCEGLGNARLLGDVTNMDSLFTLESQNRKAVNISTEKEQLNGKELGNEHGNPILCIVLWVTGGFDRIHRLHVSGEHFTVASGNKITSHHSLCGFYLNSIILRCMT